MARFSDLPEEVVVEILSWLPAESLMRFKCVRKSWYALIKNPKFVAKQLASQIQSSSINKDRSNVCIVFRHLVLTNAGEKELVLSLLSYDNKTEATLANSDVSVSVNHWNLPNDEISSPYLDLTGHCNGIICLSSVTPSDDVILVNPAIREFRILPQSSCIPTPPPLSPHEYSTVDRFISGFGFGYDSKTDDYKVVRIVRFQGFYGNPISQGIEVYTLSTNSWREINNAATEIRIINSNNFQRYFNGVFYWWGPMIYAFDLSDEVFQMMPLPDSVDFEKYSSFMVVNESLTLFNYPSNGDRNFIDMWTLDEFGVNGTWSKILTIDFQGIATSIISTPLVFLKNDELLVQMGHVNGQVVSYNLGTKEIKNHLPARDITEDVAAEIYVRSLVSVKGGNKLA